MVKRVQLIRHIKSAADLFLGLVGEPTINTTDNAIRIHDGARVGGHEMARKDVANVPAAGVTDGKMTSTQAGDLSSTKTAVDAHIDAASGHPVATPSADGFASAADKTKLDAIEAAATADQSAAEILTAIKTVDGAGSELDADLLDGLNQTAAATADTIMRRDAAGRAKVVAPAVDTDIANKAYADSLAEFASGTKMLFQQTSAPTGWTKESVHNNKALRLVTGSVGSGGSIAFTTAFNATKATNAFTLLATHLPAHTHAFGSLSAVSAGAHTHSYDKPDDAGSGTKTGGTNTVAAGTTDSQGAHTHTMTGSTGSIGSGTGHSHVVPLNVQYADVIIAIKD